MSNLLTEAIEAHWGPRCGEPTDADCVCCQAWKEFDDLTALRTTKLEKFKGHTPGPWLLATSNSWRRVVTDSCRSVCEPIAHHRDNQPDLHFRNGGDDGPDAKLLVAGPELLAEIESLLAQLTAETARADAAERELAVLRKYFKLTEDARGAQHYAADCLLEHFHEDGSLRGGGVWRGKAIADWVKKFIDAENAISGQLNFESLAKPAQGAGGGE